MKDESVQRLEFSDEFLLDSAEKRLKNGDYLGALTVLNKRSGLFEPSADASALYADVYEEMELYPLAADSWFRFLDTCNEADFSEGYEGLAVCFMNMGNEVQSALYYHRILAEDGELSDDAKMQIAEAFGKMQEPELRLVHAEGGDPEALQKGYFLLKAGQLKEARDLLGELPPENPDYASAQGLSAMCALMLGEEENAERECEALLKEHPDNVQALTTYCAVLGARGDKEGAQKVARHLAALPTEGVDDLYRAATALCETELDEEAFRKLALLRDKLPYDENVLWFYAAAAYRTGRIEDGIDALEMLTTVYPRKAVAAYYLVRMRELRDGDGEAFPMTYYYRVPAEEYRTVANFLLTANAADEEEAEELGSLSRLGEFFRIAFDEMEGRDEKLQVLAVKVAIKCRCDSFLREILLDYEGNESVKLSALHELTMRNEDNSFGTVVYGIYKEFFTRELELGPRKRTEFLRAFSDVYAKYALLTEENGEKICVAAEDVYRALAEAGAWEYFDERSALAAAIYREGRLADGERGIEAIAKLFGAAVKKVKKILDYMM